MLSYQETVQYLYAQLPAFQKYGKNALKPAFTNILKLCSYLENPQDKFKSIHVAGTNGKGSSSHMIASVLQEAGYKTGLYTSPHLKDFRERFRINGSLASESYIINFVKKHREFIEEVKPSFFELTVAMAFNLFAEQKVDIAVIEVGLGGRLDSTNIISPLVSLITNIGLDHTDVLGNTLEEIACEKGGIIKDSVPVVISERQQETNSVFENLAKLRTCPIYFAEDFFSINKGILSKGKTKYIVNDLVGENEWELRLDLNGSYQKNNVLGVLTIFEVLVKYYNYKIDNDFIIDGLTKVVENTGLKGRWQLLSESPKTICDTGHNEHAFKTLLERINNLQAESCHFVLGFAKDKSLEGTLGILPKNANFYFSEFDSFRTRKVEDLSSVANIFNIENIKCFKDVNKAIHSARSNAKSTDFIYIGGSTYLVAEIDDL